VCPGSVWLGCRVVKGSALVSPGFESGVFALRERREKVRSNLAPGIPGVCIPGIAANTRL
jgi:hypothetical protein